MLFFVANVNAAKSDFFGERDVVACNKGVCNGHDTISLGVLRKIALYEPKLNYKANAHLAKCATLCMIVHDGALVITKKPAFGVGFVLKVSNSSPLKDGIE